jgi:hypothetical protein
MNYTVITNLPPQLIFKKVLSQRYTTTAIDRLEVQFFIHPVSGLIQKPLIGKYTRML